MMTTMEIRIHLFEHKKTGLLAAVSFDLHGLVVHGRTEEEIEHKLPEAIRELVEASGRKISKLEVEQDSAMRDAGFGPAMFIASAAFDEQLAA